MERCVENSSRPRGGGSTRPSCETSSGVAVHSTRSATASSTGAPEFVEPRCCRLSRCGDLRSLADLAPLHQPKSLRGVDVVAHGPPGVPAVGCFDTAFPWARYPRLRRTRSRRVAGDGPRRFGFPAAHSWLWRIGRPTEIGQPVLSATRVRDVPPRNGGIRRGELTAVRRRHDDGLHAARGSRHGDPLGSARPRRVVWLQEHVVCPVEARQHPRAGSGLVGLTGTADMRVNFAGRGWRRRKGEPRGRDQPAPLCAGQLRRWQRPWMAPTGSRSPVEWGRARPRSVDAPPMASALLGSVLPPRGPTPRGMTTRRLVPPRPALHTFVIRSPGVTWSIGVTGQVGLLGGASGTHRPTRRVVHRTASGPRETAERGVAPAAVRRQDARDTPG